MPTPRSTLYVSTLSTFVLGILSGALGPLLPALSARIGVPVEALGAIFSALFLGALLTQFTGGWLNERLGLHRVVIAGNALLTIGIAGVAVGPSLPMVLAFAFVAGLGQGALDIGTNVLVATVFDERHVVSAVNVMHFGFGAGAVVSPVLAAWALQRWGSPMPALGAGVLLGAAALLLSTRHLLRVRAAQPAAQAAGPRTLYGRPTLWALGLLMLLYVGAEMGVGGWTAVYLDRTTTLGPPLAALVVSGYWLALTGGRLLGAALGARLASRALTALSLAGCCLGGLLLVAGVGHVAPTIAGTLLLGLCFGPIFPTVVVIAAELFRTSPSRAVSVVVSMSSLGGMLLPPLQGILLERVSPRASVALLALCTFLMLGLLLLVERGGARGRPAPAPAA